MEIVVQVNTDSIATVSISSRRGAGRVRHVEVRELWAQEKVRRGELSIIKVKGEDNVADGLTKHVDRSKLEKYKKSADSPSAIGDMSFALVSEMFQYIIELNKFN